MPWPLVHAASAATIHASHQGERDGDDIVWTTRYDAAEVPLVDPEGVAAGLVDGGRVADGVLRATGTVRVRQHGHDGLHPPWAAGTGTQRVTVEGFAFTPVDELGLQRHVDGWMRPDLTRGERSAAAALGRHGSFPIYVTADERLLDAGGLAGTVAPIEDTSTPVWMSLAGVFVASVVALESVRRGFRRQVRREDRARYVSGLADGSAAPDESG
jgi:hypothetical protein